MGHRFDQDTAPVAGEALPDGRMRYGLRLDPEWNVVDALHGGYLLAVATRAGLADDPHPDPLAVSAVFLRAPQPGPAQALVERTRSGKRVGYARVLLSQDGAPFLDATVTTGTLPDEDAEPVWDQVAPPVVAPVEEVPDSVMATPEGRKIGMGELREVRLDPAMPLLRGEFTGPARTAAYLRFSDGREPDAVSLAYFADVLPPVTMALGRFGWVPTMQFTLLVRARPRPGWLFVEQTGGLESGGFLDEDVRIWDSAGRLVAQARQLAVSPRG